MPRWALLGIVLLIAIGAAIVFPLFPRLQGSGATNPHDWSLDNVRDLALAVEMYVTDYERVPDPRAWSDLLMPHVMNPDTFRCSQAPKLRCAYAFNDGAAGADEKLLRSPEGARLVTIFESDRGWNAHGGRELLPTKPRHFDGDHYGFLDGHAQWFKRGDTSVPMQWQVAAPGRPRGPAAGQR